jgi:hypothetical protein
MVPFALICFHIRAGQERLREVFAESAVPEEESGLKSSSAVGKPASGEGDWYPVSKSVRDCDGSSETPENADLMAMAECQQFTMDGVMTRRS